MSHPGETSGWALERFMDYLHLLARMQLGSRGQGQLAPSDIVQQTLLEAHCKLHQRGSRAT
jgi:hypothetical protein